MCLPEHFWLGWVPFCIKHNDFFVFTIVYCLSCESVLALQFCRSWGEAGVKAASPVYWLLPSREKFPSFISFLSSLICRPWGIRFKRERFKSPHVSRETCAGFFSPFSGPFGLKQAGITQNKFWQKDYPSRVKPKTRVQGENVSITGSLDCNFDYIPSNPDCNPGL